VWRVEVTKLEDLGDLTAATCTGGVDRAVHTAASLVRDYLSNLERRDKAANLALLSRSWKRLPQSSRYFAFEEQLDMSAYGSHGRGGRCVDIDASEPNAVHLSTHDCFIERGHKSVNLRFTVVPKPATNGYEIGGIEPEEW
jgi:hypothetical protein